jgi:hypothetical protein
LAAKKMHVCIANPIKKKVEEGAQVLPPFPGEMLNPTVCWICYVRGWVKR